VALQRLVPETSILHDKPPSPNVPAMQKATTVRNTHVPRQHTCWSAYADVNVVARPGLVRSHWTLSGMRVTPRGKGYRVRAEG
jgi:hypothetical protein